MERYRLDQFDGLDLSVALAGSLEDELAEHFDKHLQEDLTFAYWQPSQGARRFTAVLSTLMLPRGRERALHGNASFTGEYVSRVLDHVPPGFGVAFLHSHPGHGWQDMSLDDEAAERDVLAGPVASTTGLPLLGLTWGMDRSLSARFWLRSGRRHYEKRWAECVRSVGRRLRMTFHPSLKPAPTIGPTQLATASVWGKQVQADLARLHVGIVGLGSVGSIVAEALGRIGVGTFTLVDFDVIEDRNLDRTLGAYADDAKRQTPKVDSAERLIRRSHTSATLEVKAVNDSVIRPRGWHHALDCDVIFSCVDRPLPRHVLNATSYGHLIPMIDGGILARVSELGRLMHLNWRIQTVGPGHSCLYCQNALLRSDVALDRDGMLDNPDYMKGLTHDERERYGRRNVFAFSLSVAAHEVMQLAGLISGNERVGGIGPQSYHGYPGELYAIESRECVAECDISPLTATVMALENLAPIEGPTHQKDS